MHSLEYNNLLQAEYHLTDLSKYFFLIYNNVPILGKKVFKIQKKIS